MDKLFRMFNNILANLDPIGVGAAVAEIEYTGYIPRIIANAKNEQVLMEYLERMLIYDMGLSYDKNDPIQYKTVETVCKEILENCGQEK